ncbi:MAG: T9SS type A sorting domain-containing protein [candidate division KSB1 bacterium]|nr:T9SS type A sorting domain-containing protein [candidate division KSB1 bacterium]
MKRFLILLAAMIPCFTQAQWSHSPDTAKAALLGSFFNSIVADGDGGAIILGRKNSLYTAQKVNKDGYIVWDPTLQGLTVIIPDSANDVTIGRDTYLWPDGKGGVYIGYDYYDFLRILTDPEYVVIYDLDTYVQHLDEGGRRIWGNKGIPLSTLKGTNPNYYNVAASQIMALGGDGHGGIVAVWNFSDYDSLGNVSGGTYIQRVDASGSVLWEENGRRVSAFGSVQALVDEQGSVFVVTLQGNSSGTDLRRHILKINVAGQLLWERPVSISIDNLIGGKILSDGLGGVYILSYAYDQIDPEKKGIIATRFDKDGNELWGERGIVICDSIGSQGFMESAIKFKDSDFIVSWTDARKRRNVYLQRVDCNGALLWNERGIPVSSVGSFKMHCRLLETSGNEIIAIFHDRRDSIGITYAQKFNENGEAQWRNIDVLVSTRIYPGKLISDGRGGAIISSGQAGPDRGVYIYRVDKDGNLGGVVSVKHRKEDDVPKRFDLYQNHPNPFIRETVIRYSLPSGPHYVQLKVYNIHGEEVVTLVNEIQAKGNHVVRWSGVNHDGMPVAAGVYFYKLQVGQVHLVKKLVVMR